MGAGIHSGEYDASHRRDVVKMPLVGVVMGSKSDAEAMQPTLDVLGQLGIEYDVSVISAHRRPETVREYGQQAADRGRGA